MKKLIVGIGIVGLLITGCTNAEISTLHSWGARHKVELYSANGSIIQTWNTTGTIVTDQGGQLFFQDESNNMPVYGYRTYVVTVIK